MKRAGWIITAAAACVLAAVAVLAIVGATMKAIHPERPHPICLISHRAVILIPTVCGAHEVCARPIVAELCDSVEMPAK
jgi:hypothetical protein